MPSPPMFSRAWQTWRTPWPWWFDNVDFNIDLLHRLPWLCHHLHVWRFLQCATITMTALARSWLVWLLLFGSLDNYDYPLHDILITTACPRTWLPRHRHKWLSYAWSTHRFIFQLLYLCDNVTTAGGCVFINFFSLTIYYNYGGMLEYK
jgi:hypothetical protein